MSQFKHIDVYHAQVLLEDEGSQLVDIRDLQSYALSHITSAYHLTNDTVTHFLKQTSFDQCIFVMCYHGISSQNVAQYLVNQGFKCVYSIDGGFDAWQKANLPLIK